MPRISQKQRIENLKNDGRFIRIEASLLEQLENNKIDLEYNRDLISDYMALWITKCMLIDDINKRGVTVLYNNGGGQKGRKKNESVTELTKVNTQMLKILDNLGLKPINVIADAGDGDDPL
ncbi:hypothetical protein MKC54_05215 [[Clostridium] innocuum]|nr:hypothetical protein [[Clostridium] innocuum]MCR0576280.1 hypothetical protein [[Clostridium] innocuum]